MNDNPFKPTPGCDHGVNTEYVCDKDERFPTEKMREIIDNLKYEHKIALKALSKTFRPKRIENDGRSKPNTGNIGIVEPLCPIASKVHYPLKAKNRNGNWR